MSTEEIAVDGRPMVGENDDGGWMLRCIDEGAGVRDLGATLIGWVHRGALGGVVEREEAWVAMPVQEGGALCNSGGSRGEIWGAENWLNHSHFCQAGIKMQPAKDS